MQHQWMNECWINECWIQWMNECWIQTKCIIVCMQAMHVGLKTFTLRDLLDCALLLMKHAVPLCVVCVQEPRSVQAPLVVTIGYHTISGHHRMHNQMT